MGLLTCFRIESILDEDNLVFVTYQFVRKLLLLLFFVLVTEILSKMVESKSCLRYVRILVNTTKPLFFFLFIIDPLCRSVSSLQILPGTFKLSLSLLPPVKVFLLDLLVQGRRFRTGGVHSFTTGTDLALSSD